MHHLLLKGIEYAEKKKEPYSIYRCLTSKVFEYRIYTNVYDEIKAGFMPNIDIKSIDIHKAIHYAAWGGHRWLVNNFYYTVKTTDRFWYYIEGACKGGHTDLVEYFIHKAFQHRVNQEFMERYTEDDVVRSSLDMIETEWRNNTVENKLDNVEDKTQQSGCLAPGGRYPPDKTHATPTELICLSDTYLEAPQPRVLMSFYHEMLSALYISNDYRIIPYMKFIEELIAQYRQSLITRSIMETNNEDHENVPEIYYSNKKFYQLNAKMGDLEWVKFNLEEANEDFQQAVMTGAVIGGHIEMIEYIQNNTNLRLVDFAKYIAHSVDYKKLIRYLTPLHNDIWEIILIESADVSMDQFKEVLSMHFMDINSINHVIRQLIDNDQMKYAIYLIDTYDMATEIANAESYIFRAVTRNVTSINKYDKHNYKLFKYLLEKNNSSASRILAEGIMSNSYHIVQLALSHKLNWYEVKKQILDIKMILYVGQKEYDRCMKYIDKMIAKQESTASSI